MPDLGDDEVYGSYGSFTDFGGVKESRLTDSLRILIGFRGGGLWILIGNHREVSGAFFLIVFSKFSMAAQRSLTDFYRIWAEDPCCGPGRLRTQEEPLGFRDLGRFSGWNPEHHHLRTEGCHCREYKKWWNSGFIFFCCICEVLR